MRNAVTYAVFALYEVEGLLRAFSHTADVVSADLFPDAKPKWEALKNDVIALRSAIERAEEAATIESDLEELLKGDDE